MKHFVALARVSSREQERDGFSLDVQEDALRAYAQRHGAALSLGYWAAGNWGVS
jgi:DNA invertase Pin-like site-specific DNA recombinase